MKFLLSLLAPAMLASQLAAAPLSHHILDALLKDHVEGGLVNYAAIKNDPRLDQYLEQLAQASPEAEPDDPSRLALWINAYNAYTLKLVASAYPVETIRLIEDLGKTAPSIEQGKPWKIPFAVVGGNTYTLDQIEHEVIRAQFKEPRIHFAIVCAAVACPLLRNEAYTAPSLEEQLEDQARWFFAWRNTFDIESRQAGLSKILEWFAHDFGGSQENVLRFAAPYLDKEVAASILSKPSKWKVAYLEYDWQLNDLK